MSARKSWSANRLRITIRVRPQSYMVRRTNRIASEWSNVIRHLPSPVLSSCVVKKTTVGSEMYNAYASWCQENGFYATNSRKFYAEFRKRYVGQPGQQTGRVGETDCNRGTLFHGIGVLVDGHFPVIGDVVGNSPF